MMRRRRSCGSVCRRWCASGLQGRKGRIAVNDSKKLKTKAAGVKHLETGVLAFTGLLGAAGAFGDVADWLDFAGETRHRGEGEVPSLEALPWYVSSASAPWQGLPSANTPEEIAIARSMLATTCQRIGITLG